jgi:tetratricopeptide (TPR) repeat protein
MARKAIFICLTTMTVFFLVSSGQAESIAQIYQQSYNEEAKGNYGEAILILGRAERAGDNSYLLHLRFGWLQYLSGKYPESANSYRKAILKDKNSIEAKLGLMLPLMAQGRWADAEKVGEEIVAVDKLSYLGNSRLAYIYYNLKLYKDAESYYRKVLTYYPGDVEMMAGLGWSLMKQGKKEAAEKSFAEVLRYAPNHVSANAAMRMIRGQ